MQEVEEEILNEIILNKELIDSPLLLAWIQESENNRDTFIAYKNRYALLQSGDEMSEQDILKDLKSVRKAARKSKSYSLRNTFLKYAAVLALVFIGGYTYHFISVNLTKQVPMTEISASEGQRNLFLLPDGSEIILVNNSKLIYPTKFSDKVREVYLEGVAYLTVEQDKKKPFIVHVGDHEIEVLGTEFLVTAYPQDDLVQVDLISGKVKVDVAQLNDIDNYDSYLLETKETLKLNKKDGSVAQYTFEDDFYKFWKNGEYVFKKETFASLALKLERVFNVEIQFDDEGVSSSEFTGVIEFHSDLISTLNVFKTASSIPFTYNIKNKFVAINVMK